MTWWAWLLGRPEGRTLQERYPAAPGVPTFSYSSVDLPEEAFVAGPRKFDGSPDCILQKRADGTWYCHYHRRALTDLTVPCWTAWTPTD